MVVGADLGQLGVGETHMARAGNVKGQTAFLAGEPGRETERAEKERRGGFVMRQPRLSTAGAKVIKCLMPYVYIRDELGGIPPKHNINSPV